MPVPNPTSVVFGGPGRTTLYVTTSTHRVDVDAFPLSGAVLALDAGVAGLPAEPYRG
jgi:sugar lactone lactonase YvrE